MPDLSHKYFLKNYIRMMGFDLVEKISEGKTLTEKEKILEEEA